MSASRNRRAIRDRAPYHAIGSSYPVAGSRDRADGVVRAALVEDLNEFVARSVGAAEPELEVRHETGVKVILFLIVMTLLLYAYKRRVWAKVH